jgi:hypothetical protein
MGGEHDDDMDLEVNEGLTGETEHYVMVAEDLEERQADAEEGDRAKASRDALREAQEGGVDEG